LYQVGPNYIAIYIRSSEQSLEDYLAAFSNSYHIRLVQEIDRPNVMLIFAKQRHSLRPGGPSFSSPVRQRGVGHSSNCKERRRRGTDRPAVPGAGPSGLNTCLPVPLHALTDVAIK
jgi:hypothetical protein